MKIFLSYANADREWAKQLAGALEDLGYSVWWDQQIIPGEHFRDVIDEQLKAAIYIVVLWTPSAAVSPWVLEEADEGAKSGKLVPIIAKQIEIPRGFRNYQSIDLTEWDGDIEQTAFNLFLQAIGRQEKAAPRAELSRDYSVGIAARANVYMGVVALFMFVMTTIFTIFAVELSREEMLEDLTIRFLAIFTLVILTIISLLVTRRAVAEYITIGMAFTAMFAATSINGNIKIPGITIENPSNTYHIILICVVVGIFSYINILKYIFVLMLGIGFYTYGNVVLAEFPLYAVVGHSINLSIVLAMLGFAKHKMITGK